MDFPAVGNFRSAIRILSLHHVLRRGELLVAILLVVGSWGCWVFSSEVVLSLGEDVRAIDAGVHVVICIQIWEARFNFGSF
jgi:hypothetical protein